MAICVTTNVVCMGGGYFKQTPTGVEFTGCAESFQFIDCRTPTHRGETCGFGLGGSRPFPPAPASTNFEKWPFASDSNATNVADVPTGTADGAGHSSYVAGYTAGGDNGGNLQAIQKFTFASNSNGAISGQLSQARRSVGGSHSREAGYTHGGYNPARDTIDKFNFASDGDANALPGTLTQARLTSGGNGSGDFGYAVGGLTVPGVRVDIIERYPFSADAGAGDVGDLSQGRHALSSQDSLTHGYSTGGVCAGGSAINTISKFPFASGSTNDSDVGELSQNGATGFGVSSFTHGYKAGGYNGGVKGDIEKFAFASDGNASDIGQLVAVKRENTSSMQAS